EVARATATWVRKGSSACQGRVKSVLGSTSARKTASSRPRSAICPSFSHEAKSRNHSGGSLCRQLFGGLARPLPLTLRCSCRDIRALGSRSVDGQCRGHYGNGAAGGNSGGGYGF